MATIIRVIGGLVAFAAILALVQYTNLTAPQPAAVAYATPSENAIAGTLTYSRTNTGAPITYLVYKTPSGAIVTKVIQFDTASSCATAQGTYPCSLVKDALPTYYPAGSVHAEGSVNAENILVRSLSTN